MTSTRKIINNWNTSLHDNLATAQRFMLAALCALVLVNIALAHSSFRRKVERESILLLRQPDAAHEVGEARVGAQRIDDWKHFEIGDVV